ncbi:hypothetical protein BH11PSE12_BH11PSE12_06240 [soil metagenome]
MNTYQVKDDLGHPFAFEVENAYIRPRKIAELLAQTEGVSDISIRKLFGSSPDTHVKFKYFGTDFVVYEPFGDSSRYWIGPKDEQNYFSTPIEKMEEIFKRYQLPILIKIFGDVLTLNFKSLHKGRKPYR